MSRIKLIHHVNIEIGDRERTREWYQRVFGCEFLDRGPALNKRQLQLRLGNSEMHFSEVKDREPRPVGHFAVEVADWDDMLAHLDKETVAYNRVPPGSRSNLGGDNPRFGNREDNGEFFTYIHDPDGNMIELLYHPLGWEDSKGNAVKIQHDPQGMGLAQKPGWVAQQYAETEVKTAS
jgi:catechol 2,3-dioxygenase-like lactoylglutathione lyase family enzyme